MSAFNPCKEIREAREAGIHERKLANPKKCKHLRFKSAMHRIKLTCRSCGQVFHNTHGGLVPAEQSVLNV